MCVSLTQRSVRFMGRLDGHQVSTTPLDYSAWWIKRGQVFVSHPLADGDVAWEALVTDRELHVSVCVCVCVCVHVCVHVCVCVFMCMCVYVCMCELLCMCEFTCHGCTRMTRACA